MNLLFKIMLTIEFVNWIVSYQTNLLPELLVKFEGKNKSKVLKWSNLLMELETNWRSYNVVRERKLIDS